jgi:peptide/nickel transport system substrate-binding protein
MSLWTLAPIREGRIAIAAAAALGLASIGFAQAQEKVVRAVLHADVRVLDPIWTTQTIANIHGMLVYGTLFGNDANMQPKPQMVDNFEISEDKLVYTFTLRDKLKFHDGSPVTSKDVIASLDRWGKKDGVGQRLFSFLDRLEELDGKTFRMTLKKPYGMVLESLGKTNSSVAVIMRAQDAATDPQQQVKEAIGSGHFKFAKDRWVPGSKAVYLKNADYVPRPASEKAESYLSACPELMGQAVDRLAQRWGAR